MTKSIPKIPEYELAETLEERNSPSEFLITASPLEIIFVESENEILSPNVYDTSRLLFLIE